MIFPSPQWFYLYSCGLSPPLPLFCSPFDFLGLSPHPLAFQILSRDSVTVSVDGVVYYRVSDPIMAETNVEDYRYTPPTWQRRFNTNLPKPPFFFNCISSLPLLHQCDYDDNDGGGDCGDDDCDEKIL